MKSQPLSYFLYLIYFSILILSIRGSQQHNVPEEFSSAGTCLLFIPYILFNIDPVDPLGFDFFNAALDKRISRNCYCK